MTGPRKPGPPELVALLLLCCGSLSAALGHHSNRAIYDREEILSIEGIVTEVWYQNPHSRMYVEVTEESGDTALWQAETLDRSQLDRRGWKYNDLVEGDFVVVTGRVAFDGSNRLQMLTIGRLGRRRLRRRLGAPLAVRISFRQVAADWRRRRFRR